MPYKVPEDSRSDQIKVWFQSRPELAKSFADKNYREKLAQHLRDQGIEVTAEELLDPEVLTQLGKIDGLEGVFPFVQDSIADKKREYYDENPDQDPQSTTSKFLEFIGLDEPYYNDSRSYDYQQKKWDESANKGNPDLSWFLPAITESGNQVLDGSMPSVYGNEDPRTQNEKWQGAVMGALNFPLWGTEDEVTAAFTSAVDGTPYDRELERSRRIKEQHAEHTPIWSQVPESVAGLPIAAPVINAGAGAAQKGIGGVRKAIGLAPKAKTATGAAIQEAAAVTPAVGAESSLWQLGEADGDLDERVRQYDPNMTYNMMAFPAFMGVGGAAQGLVSDMAPIARKTGRYVKGKWDKFWGSAPDVPARVDARAPAAPSQAPFRPKPRKRPKPPKGDIPKGATPQSPISSVRDDIETAMQQSNKRRK